jgi:hypothetical protein
MDKRLLFDLLEYPICPVGDGNLVVFDSPGALRQAALRGTEDQIVDVARDQSRHPALVTRREVCLLKGGSRQLAFATDRFGQVLDFSGPYPNAVFGSSSSEASAPLLALNTLRGAWIMEVADDGVIVIANEPLPFLVSSFWEQRGTPTFGGASLRVAQPGGDDDPEYSVGAPCILTVEGSHPSRGIRARPLSERLPLDRWVDIAPANVKDNPRFTKAVDPEICFAGEADHVAVALTGLYDGYDPLDVRARFPTHREMFGLIFGNPGTGALERVAAYVCPVASLRAQSGHYLYIGENVGRGAELANLQRVKLDAAPAGEPVQMMGVDTSLRCTSFCPCFHPRIGYFGTLRAGTGDGNDAVYFVHSDEGLKWNVVGTRETVKVVDPSA